MNTLEEFDKWLSERKDKTLALAKVRFLKNNKKGSGINEGEVFVGQITLRHSESLGGSQVMVNGGWTANTSLVVGVSQKGPNKWMIKTQTSVYKVETIE